MKSDNRVLLVVLAVVLVLLLIVCCAGAAFVYFVYSNNNPNPLGSQPSSGAVATAPAVPRPRQGQTLVLRPLGEPLTFDPHLVQDAESAEYVVHIFSGLVGIDQNLKLTPDLAEKWDISPDGKTYTFTLRKDAKFQDGRQVTAQDVKYSFERALDPRTGSPVADTYLGDIVGAHERLANRASEVAGIKVVNDATVQITIDAPKPYFLWQLTYTSAYIVDRTNVEKGGATWADKPNGTGPFKLTSKTTSDVVLTRNDNYYGVKPTLTQVKFLLTGAAMTRYETGEIDLVQVTSADIDRVTDETNPYSKQLLTADQFSFSYLGFDTSVAPFDDPKVRQAIAYAIDKSKLTAVVLKGMATTADGILPPGMPGYNKALNKLTFDPAKAKQLLAQSKYAAALPPITLYVLGSGAAPTGTPPAIQEMLKQNLGMTMDIQLVETGAFFSGLFQRKYAMFITGWIADYPDAYDFLDVLFHSKSALNHGNVSNAQLDALLDAARVERDEAKRTQLYQQAEQLLVSESVVIPLDYARDYWLVKPYVKGVQRPPLIIPWLSSISIEGQ
jgi:oligopeptide transport system substrate-binding protein